LSDSHSAIQIYNELVSDYTVYCSKL